MSQQPVSGVLPCWHHADTKWWCRSWPVHLRLSRMQWHALSFCMEQVRRIQWLASTLSTTVRISTTYLRMNRMVPSYSSMLLRTVVHPVASDPNQKTTIVSDFDDGEHCFCGWPLLATRSARLKPSPHAGQAPVDTTVSIVFGQRLIKLKKMSKRPSKLGLCVFNILFVSCNWYIHLFEVVNRWPLVVIPIAKETEAFLSSRSHTW